jgi:hypothetical protein
MYNQHIENAPKKMQGIAAHFNPMAASASIANNTEKKNTPANKAAKYSTQAVKKTFTKIWAGRIVMGNMVAGNSYSFAKHGLIGSDLKKAQEVADSIKK